MMNTRKWPLCSREVSVLVIRPHYEELRTSASNGFKEVRFFLTLLERPAPDCCL
jgi:hypothetical protein